MRYFTEDRTEIPEDELHDYVAEHYTLDDHEEYLNEVMEEVRIGTMTFVAGTAFRKLDEIAFEEDRDYCIEDMVRGYKQGYFYPCIGILIDRED